MLTTILHQHHKARRRLELRFFSPGLLHSLYHTVHVVQLTPLLAELFDCRPKSVTFFVRFDNSRLPMRCADLDEHEIKGKYVTYSQMPRRRPET